jgi:hypothetical protein
LVDWTGVRYPLEAWEGRLFPPAAAQGGGCPLGKTAVSSTFRLPQGLILKFVRCSAELVPSHRLAPPASSEGTFHSFSFLPHTIAHRSLPAPLHPSMSLPHFRVTSTVPYQPDRGRMHHPARTTRCASSPPTPQACCAMTTDYSPYQFCLFLDSFLT